MNQPTHISKEDLLHLISERPTALPPDEIESHVSDCEACQTLLLDLAAESTWREQFSSSIGDLPSLAEGIETAEISSADTPDSTLRCGDEFDLQTIDNLLAEVLESSIHPEMLGRLGRYDVESVIGCGGMGAVLRAFDRDLHRPVAIKMILPRLAKNGTAKQRFAREARAAAAVLHPNVIGIHGIDESKGIPWFVMPLITGPSLQSLVEQRGPLPAHDIVRIGMQIAAGLSAAHSQGLVHRDIKPANVLVDNEINRVVITDFGLARREAEEAMTQTGALAGTLNYMSPEQSRGSIVDGRSDLFSLGSLLFYLATGVVPFRAESALGVLHRIGTEDHPPVQSLNPDIPSTLSDIIDRLLAKAPADRFQSAVELERVLMDYLAHLHQPMTHPRPVVQSAVEAVESSTNPKRAWRGPFFRFLLPTGVAAGLALAAWLAVTQPKQANQEFTHGKSAPEQTAPANQTSSTWANVATKFGLDDPAVIPSKLNQVDLDMDRLNQSLIGWNTDFQEISLAESIHELSDRMRQLDHALDSFQMDSNKTYYGIQP